MESNLYLEGRKALAIGYSFYALLYVILAGIFLNLIFSTIKSHEIDIILETLAIIKSTLLFLFFAMSTNVLLAIGSWKLLSLSTGLKRLLLTVSILIPTILIVRIIPSLWHWYQGSLPAEIGITQIMSSSLLAIGYVTLAYGLTKLVFKSSRSD